MYLSPLRNYQSGLEDHAQYFGSFSTAMSLCACGIFLMAESVKKKTVLPWPWIIGVAIEILFLIFSMYDRSRPAFSYPLSDLATGPFQMIAFIPVVIGYVVLFCWTVWGKRKQK